MAREVEVRVLREVHGARRVDRGGHGGAQTRASARVRFLSAHRVLDVRRARAGEALLAVWRDARQPNAGAVFRTRRDRPPATVEPARAAVQAVRAVVGDQGVAARDDGSVVVPHLEPRVRDAVRDAADDRAEVRAVDGGIVALQVVVPERDVRHDAVSVGNEDARDRRAEGGDVHLDAGRAQDDRAERIRSLVGGRHLEVSERRRGESRSGAMALT